MPIDPVYIKTLITSVLMAFIFHKLMDSSFPNMLPAWVAVFAFVLYMITISATFVLYMITISATFVSTLVIIWTWA